MGIIQNFINKYKERRAREKELEESMRVEKKVMQKQKSANERELESYYEEMRKRNIEGQLEAFRHHKMNEIWRSNMFAGNRNLFNGGCVFKMRGGV